MFDRGPFGCSHAAARPPARQSEEEDATSREPHARCSSSLDGYLKHHHPSCSAPEGSDAQPLHLLHSQTIEQCDTRRRQLHSQWSTSSPPLSRMYLMNAPTVAAPRTEWRACGPPGGYSIPVCFNDSDAELSARGSSISNKVQMIIESLRSSQSSLDMSEEVVTNALQRQDGPPQACKTAAGPLVTAKSKTKKRPAGVLLKDRDQSSDSDDSVDKGIEEAILQYLKEKDGHKREAELFVRSSRQTVPEIKSESQAFSIVRSRFPKSVIRATPATVPVKKYIKHKASLHEAALRNSELGRVMLRDQSTNTVKPSGLVRKIKGEDVRNDSSSSSDDGIEEAIQKYQLERIEQQTRGDLFKPLASVEESHSSSDDGIEEAIRSYQLEQLREKCAPKPQDKSGSCASGSSGLDDAKGHQPQKKQKRAQKGAKLVQPPSPTHLADSLSIEQRSQGNGLPSLRVESFAEQPPPALPKANTTAELMCAEAILDISKTVMPGAFMSHLDVGPSVCAPAGLAQRSTTPERDSDACGSVDSEDGIEQEIMKFLEQKAQMLKRSPGEPSTMTAREASRGKTPRLSFTKRRKHKDNTSSRTSALDPSSKPPKAKSPPVASPRSRDKTEQSGDKSSSLDSDEDLDTAIKALLKTKKKSKKMTRSQRDSRKRPVPEAERSRPCAKKAHLGAAAELTVSKKAYKRKSRSKDARGPAEKTAAPNAPIEKRRANCGANAVRGLPPAIAQQIKEESSSVDSDDSIEQEIRKFLAEKAEKVTIGEAEAPSNGTAPVRRDLEWEDQLAEIPRQSARPAAATPDGSALAPHRSPGPGSSARSARAEQKPPTPAGADDGLTEKVPAVDQSIKWRQSFGLPIVDPKSFGRTQFHISSSKMSASPSAASSCQGKAGELKRPTPASLWSSARRSWSAAKPPAMSPAFNPFSVALSAGRHPGAASTVHVPRDKSVFVELESGRTNHVQVQSRQSDEGKARADEGRAARDAGLEGAEEEFIDQSEGESPEKKQSTLSLSCAIDPGIVVQPCIALSTEERSSMFQRRYRKEEAHRNLSALYPLNTLM
ncbi:protein phosphatase 1 regulatory subunit 26 isoform X2 [Hippocampus comes]|uniref:protein phosphatase 1 regulatory subunit 26 isoform X2 n=1 Tax=Hippocampus comes TaxID=109280 RepID=UPI00094ED0D5|nr:PREDICTED: protein phosphatase 1 regulatory subunit 26 isoform X2 [Hippocampus comes]